MHNAAGQGSLRVHPQRSAQIANAVAKTYLDDQVRAKSRETMKASIWLKERVAEIRQTLEKSEAAVDDFRRKSGLQEVKGATIPAERLGDLNAQLNSARSERIRAEVALGVDRNTKMMANSMASSMPGPIRCWEQMKIPPR